MADGKDQVEKYVDTLKARMMAYRACFDMEAPENRTVLTDLALFCRMFTTTKDPLQTEDPNVLEGRRQVFLRIQEHLQFDHIQLYHLHPLRQLTPQALTPGTLTTGISKTRMDKNRGEMNV